MNFGLSFRGCVSLLYTSIYSRVMVNDTLGAPYSISRGVRQGCPLSPLLYVLVAETLAQAIKLDPKIDGFQLPLGTVIKSQQYADDTSCIVSSDASLCVLFDLFARFERASGAKLNISESKGLLFGSWTERTNLPIILQWSKTFLTILGCRVGNDTLPDWGNLLKSLESQVLAWKPHSLTLGGRALIANTHETRPETVPLPQDTDDDDANNEDEGRDKDNDNNENMEQEGNDETGSEQMTK